MSLYLVGHAQCWLLAYHRSDRRLTIGPKQEDENGNGNKERERERERGGGGDRYIKCATGRERERARARAREEDAVNDTMEKRTSIGRSRERLAECLS